MIDRWKQFTVSIKKMKRKLWSYQHHSSGPSLFSRLPPGHAESNPVKDVDGRPAGCLVTRKISQLGSSSWNFVGRRQEQTALKPYFWLHFPSRTDRLENYSSLPLSSRNGVTKLFRKQFCKEYLNFSIDSFVVLVRFQRIS